MRSIMEKSKAQECYICGFNGYLEVHHIFFGTANRKKSDKYGLKVHLCHAHHRDSKEGVHFNKELDKLLKTKGQQIFERIHSREKFMQEFGKNYLSEEVEYESNNGN